jgi:hypothetical protein
VVPAGREVSNLPMAEAKSAASLQPSLIRLQKAQDGALEPLWLLDVQDVDTRKQCKGGARDRCRDCFAVTGSRHGIVFAADNQRRRRDERDCPAKIRVTQGGVASRQPSSGE